MPVPPENRDEVWPISDSRQRLSVRHTHVESSASPPVISVALPIPSLLRVRGLRRWSQCPKSEYALPCRSRRGIQ